MPVVPADHATQCDGGVQSRTRGGAGEKQRGQCDRKIGAAEAKIDIAVEGYTAALDHVAHAHFVTGREAASHHRRRALRGRAGGRIRATQTAAAGVAAMAVGRDCAQAGVIARTLGAIGAARRSGGAHAGAKLGRGSELIATRPHHCAAFAGTLATDGKDTAFGGGVAVRTGVAVFVAGAGAGERAVSIRAADFRGDAAGAATRGAAESKLADRSGVGAAVAVVVATGAAIGRRVAVWASRIAAVSGGEIAEIAADTGSRIEAAAGDAAHAIGLANKVWSAAITVAAAPLPEHALAFTLARGGITLRAETGAGVLYAAGNALSVGAADCGGRSAVAVAHAAGERAEDGGVLTAGGGDQRERNQQTAKRGANGKTAHCR